MFLVLSHSSQDVNRTGWVRYKVNDPEKIASHMFGVAILGMLVRDPDVDRDRSALFEFNRPAPLRSSFFRVVKMGLVHDVAECIVGDITPHDPVSNEEKARLEQARSRLLSFESTLSRLS